jgi:hypothetical protein
MNMKSPITVLYLKILTETCDVLTTSCRGRLDLVKKLPAFMEHHNFITVFTKSHNTTLFTQLKLNPYLHLDIRTLSL